MINIFYNFLTLPLTLTMNPKLLKGLETKEKAGISQPAVCIGDPSENRTRVFAVRGRRPRPLDDGTNIFKTRF